MADTLVHFEIQADDVERAKVFYGGLFGWTFTDAGMPMSYWLVTAGRSTVGDDTFGVNGALMKRNNPAAPADSGANAFVCTISVKDIETSVAKAKELGAEILMGIDMIPNVGRFAYIRDTEGNKLGLIQPVMPA